MSIDVTEASFEADVVQRSASTPVVLDVWAPWCGPCKTLGPILDRAVAATDGQVVLAKVNADEAPNLSKELKVQGIPAVFAIDKGRVVDSFVGAKGEAEVTAFVQQLVPDEAAAELGQLLAAGDEASLRAALDIRRDHQEAVLALARLLLDDEEDHEDEVHDLLERIPDSLERRQVAARLRAGDMADDSNGVAAAIEKLLPRVKGDDEARRQAVDLLELLGPDDDRTASLRRQLTAALY